MRQVLSSPVIIRTAQSAEETRAAALSLSVLPSLSLNDEVGGELFQSKSLISLWLLVFAQD